MSDIPLILFAKVPKTGQVKTRLTPNVSLEKAAEVAKVLLTETLTLTTQYWPGKVILALWPDAKGSFIQDTLNQFKVEHVQQVSGDLGVKMFSAMESVDYPCAVMGCDVPHLPAEVLIDAHTALVHGENVLGPTDDGGYYLLGLQQSSQALFSDQTWGGDSVLESSLEKARQGNLSFTYLQEYSDIDTYEDLVKASETLKSLQPFVT